MLQDTLLLDHDEAGRQTRLIGITGDLPVHIGLTTGDHRQAAALVVPLPGLINLGAAGTGAVIAGEQPAPEGGILAGSSRIGHLPQGCCTLIQPKAYRTVGPLVVDLQVDLHPLHRDVLRHQGLGQPRPGTRLGSFSVLGILFPELPLLHLALVGLLHDPIDALLPGLDQKPAQQWGLELSTGHQQQHPQGQRLTEVLSRIQLDPAAQGQGS